MMVKEGDILLNVNMCRMFSHMFRRKKQWYINEMNRYQKKYCYQAILRQLRLLESLDIVTVVKSKNSRIKIYTPTLKGDMFFSWLFRREEE